MTSPNSRGLFGRRKRSSLDNLTAAQLQDIVPDSDPRLRARLDSERHASTLVNFLLFNNIR